MAKSQSIHLISGRLHDIIFKVRDGKQYLSMAPFHTHNEQRSKDKVHYRDYFRNQREFAAASRIGGIIYRVIKKPVNFDPIFKPYAQNTITAAIKRAVHLDTDHKADLLAQYRIIDGYHALKGLDLSPEDAPTKKVFMTPLGPLHNPDTLHINGLQAAGATLRGHVKSTIECRLHIRQARFHEFTEDPDTHEWITAADAPDPKDDHPEWNSQPSGWIPMEIIPYEGIKIPLPHQAPHEKYVTIIMIEWREHSPVGRRLRYHRKDTITRIVSIHAPAEALPLKHPHPAKNPYNVAPIKAIHIPTTDGWQQDPEAYLQEALGMLNM